MRFFSVAVDKTRSYGAALKFLAFRWLFVALSSFRNERLENGGGFNAADPRLFQIIGINVIRIIEVQIINMAEGWGAFISNFFW